MHDLIDIMLVNVSPCKEQGNLQRLTSPYATTNVDHKLTLKEQLSIVSYQTKTSVEFVTKPFPYRAKDWVHLMFEVTTSYRERANYVLKVP
jgi:hypothetical protein